MNSTTTVRDVLEAGLQQVRGPGARVVAMDGKPLGTFSSHPISRLQVTMDDGYRLPVIFKRLCPATGKDPRREADCYRRILSDGWCGAPRLYASLSDAAEQRYWLFLEDVGSWRLDWCGSRDWEPAFRFLARMHARYLGEERSLADLDCLVEHGRGFYQDLARSARESLCRHGHAGTLQRFDLLVARWLDVSISFLAERPQTFLHGDLSCHNVMVQRPLRPENVRPIDWEWAAIGVPGWDVAKLLAGWGTKKTQFLEMYMSEFDRHAASPLDRATFVREVAHCQAMHKLWYLRWWIEPCRRPTFVWHLLDRLARGWSA